ncbi:hypothetical protein [Marinovum sp.]|uniref:hypothetical protein n=1 Tax=Marinovum sp. TaxID=2024839 RepID=UPI002B2713A4|nr:hypothetical protein [Marinovum sp.]
MAKDANTRRVRALMHIPASATSPARRRGEVFEATPQQWRDWCGVKVAHVEDGAEDGGASAKKAPR